MTVFKMQIKNLYVNFAKDNKKIEDVASYHGFTTSEVKALLKIGKKYIDEEKKEKEKEKQRRLKMESVSGLKKLDKIYQLLDSGKKIKILSSVIGTIYKRIYEDGYECFVFNIHYANSCYSFNKENLKSILIDEFNITSYTKVKFEILEA